MQEPNFKQWAQNGGGNVQSQVFATLYVGQQLERIAGAMERIVAEEFDVADRASFNPDDFKYDETLPPEVDR